MSSQIVKPKVLMIGTSRKTRGGITTVVNGYLSSNIKDVFRIRYIATHRDGNYFVKIIYALSGYANFLLSLLVIRPDIFHFHVASRASFYRKTPLILLAYLLQKPIIYHLHGAEFMQFYNDESKTLKKFLIRSVLSKATVIIALSKQWRSNLLTIDETFPIQVLYNSIPIPDLEKGKDQDEKKKILFMGQLGKRKGVPELIAAAEKLSHFRVDFRIILCGDGNVPMWQEECSRKKLEDKFEFRGWVTGEEKDLLFKEADIYVLPSYNEGLPMSVLEAISYAIPVISTPIGGIPEAVVDGVNGFLVKPGDVESLAAKIGVLLEDDNLRKQFGEASRKIAEQKFDISITLRCLDEMYLKLVA